MFKRYALFAGMAILGFVGMASPASAYPGGPLWYVTDVGPYCAGCHSSTSDKQFPEQPADFASKWTVEGKHFAEINQGEAYKDMSPKDKDTLIQAIKKVDAHASVRLEAPARVKAGSSFPVSVFAQGGSGPVVGLALVDNDVRFQARPISAMGFKIMRAPEIYGPDGKAQSKWMDMRYKALDKNINFAIIFDIKADVEKDRYDTSKAVWSLRAPIDPGDYTVTAVFFYGTEKAHPLGTVEKFGKKDPKGGFLGHSGRVMFSKVMKIRVE